MGLVRHHAADWGIDPHKIGVLGFSAGGHLVAAISTHQQRIYHAQDDPVDPVEFSLLYHAALKKANVPVEMHLFAQGGHAFGLRPTKLPITKWPALVETWLGTIGMIPEK